MDEITRLQKYLALLRTTANWSVQEFAEILGVTRQTINNLERTKEPIKMSKVQYLAIRSLFTHEIEQGNKMLGQLLYCLVDHPEKMTDEDRLLIAQQAKLLSSAVKGGSTKEEINSSWSRTFSDETWAEILGVAVGVIGASLATIAIDWLDVAMKKKK